MSDLYKVRYIEEGGATIRVHRSTCRRVTFVITYGGIEEAFVLRRELEDEGYDWSHYLDSAIPELIAKILKNNS